MLKANTTIIAGDKKYHKGQAVTGLSQMDKEWMAKAGYITETAAKKESSGTKPAASEQEEKQANEF